MYLVITLSTYSKILPKVSLEEKFMREIKKLKTIFVVSWLINLNCVIQMVCLPEKCFDLYAVWKSSSTLGFCIYFLYYFFGTMANKNDNAKYLNNKEVALYYLDVFVKLLIVIFSLVFVSFFRNSSVVYLGIAIQIILIIADMLLEYKITLFFKKIFLKPVSSRKEYLIEVKPVKSDETDKGNLQYIALGYLCVMTVSVSNPIGIIIFFEEFNPLLLIVIINIAILMWFWKLWQRKATLVIKTHIKNKRIIMFIISNMVYSLSAFIFSSNILGISKNVATGVLISYACIFYSVLFVCVFYPMLKLLNGMDNYKNK